MDNSFDLLSIHKQNVQSAYLLAAWTDSSGNNSEDKIRPAKVLYFCHIN